MGEKFRRFMAGRYGLDALNKLLLILGALLLVVMWIWPYRVFEAVFFVLLIYAYFRMFSRNITKRYAENQKYLQLTAGVRNFFSRRKNRFQQRKRYRFFKCPKCGQQVRVPKGKGKISIRCPKCGESFVKKS